MSCQILTTWASLLERGSVGHSRGTDNHLEGYCLGRSLAWAEQTGASLFGQIGTWSHLNSFTKRCGWDARPHHLDL
jgi:hypothetical protein